MLPDETAAAIIGTETTTEAPPTETVETEVQPATNWYGDIADEGLKTWVDGKKYPDLLTSLKSHQELERFAGGAKNLTEIPDFENPEAAREFFNKIGRPVEAANYELDVPEQGADAELDKWFREQAHEANLTNNQAKQISAKFNEFMAQNGVANETAVQDSINTARGNLEREWGTAYKENLQNVDRAAAHNDITSEEIKAMGQSIGFERVYNMLSKIGGGLGEDRSVDGESPGTIGQNQQTAQTELERLKSDTTFQSYLLDPSSPNYKVTHEKWINVLKMAHSDG